MPCFVPGDESIRLFAVRDPVWKHIRLTQEFLDITRTEPFMRLYRIRQLGPTEYVYPGATHTRASHSFGVYAAARKFLETLCEQGASEWITPKGARSFLAAALLHDLGHFPFTHSLKELPLEDHETLTAKLVVCEPLRTLIAQAGADPDMSASIIDLSGAYGSQAASVPDQETVFFRNLLSGVLDPDKLDYLNRDAYFCGVPYGIQDIDFILSQVHPDPEKGIVLDSRGILSVENILFSKYLMYRSVYWHRQVRIATAMMKKTLHAALSASIISPEELYPLDDTSLYSLIDSRSFPEQVLARDIRMRSFYRVVGEFRPGFDELAATELEHLAVRTEIENRLAEAFTLWTGVRFTAVDVLLDIPERISFESDLYISDEKRIFTASSTVFSESVISRFTESLRILRVAVNPQKADALERTADLPEKLAKCIGLYYTEMQD